MKSILNKEEYADFTKYVDICQSKGTEVPHIVTHERGSDTYEIKLLGNPNLDLLDSLIT